MLNNIGLPGLLLIVIVTVVLFGRGKVSGIMGELGTGLTAFKRGLREAEDPAKQESDVSRGTDATTESSHLDGKS
ncbi:twin-arginine translocase TatA/TatE family subunit [Paracoccus onubensis]|uniref:Sec-independent protein translocase TatA n=1 Tax=Paracoccus onubensis TaxID=1675788 RepID=A0A418T291_9RHOB|nr:twin-arginine translocase TatA/TatE family subunit [Paracoccus onubensis]RJE87324.1 Sec-independent protein translocase TatA [Paracoccus onubensis]